MGWCADDPNTFCSIGERDIDFLLLEELRCSQPFRQWFLSAAMKALSVGECPECALVQHSVHRTGVSTGETDLLVTFEGTSRTGTGVQAVLIEDKIDAEFSDRTKCGSKQTERYRAEIEKMIARGEWVAAVVMLVAPKDYLSGVGPTAFDATVSYESICEWFASEASKSTGETACRMEHHRQMMDAALSRWRRGWERQSDDTVGILWSRYHEIASNQFADVRMNYKGGQPSDSYTVSFDCLPRVDGLPKCRIDNVMERGTVDILIPGYAVHLSLLSDRLKSALPPEARLRKAGMSLGINVRVPPISRFRPAIEQTTAIVEALSAVRGLKHWFEQNAKLLPVPAIAT